jgi:hypothetical protein
MRRWTVNPPMGQVIGGWIGAMIVLGIAGGWLFGPTQVTLHTVPPGPRQVTATSDDAVSSTVTGTIGGGVAGLQRGAHPGAAEGRTP